MSQLDKMVFFGHADNDDSEDAERINTRFGEIQLQKNSPLFFPRGILGMPDRQRFFITNFPSKKLQKFKLMQSLDDFALSFITLPVDIHNNIITAEDLTFSCKDLGIKPEHLVSLLIVSVHRMSDKISISVNARAPLLIDSHARLAAQYVFQTDKYKVQHYITT